MTTFLLKFWDLSGAKVWKSCRSRKSWKNEYLVAIVAVDTAENGPPKVWPNWINYSVVSLPATLLSANLAVVVDPRPARAHASPAVAVHGNAANGGLNLRRKRASLADPFFSRDGFRPCGDAISFLRWAMPIARFLIVFICVYSVYHIGSSAFLPRGVF